MHETWSHYSYNAKVKRVNDISKIEEQIIFPKKSIRRLGVGGVFKSSNLIMDFTYKQIERSIFQRFCIIT